MTEKPSLAPSIHTDDDMSTGSSSNTSDDGTGEFGAFKSKHNKKKGGVHFGSVRVRTHEMTLGDNPGCLTPGPPLTLEWDPTESTRFANVDEFAETYHGQDADKEEHHPAHRLEGRLRQQIAAQHHSAGSIRRVQMEVYEIRADRKKSSQEDPTAVAETVEKVDSKKATKHQHGGGGFLNRFFKH